MALVRTDIGTSTDGDGSVISASFTPPANSVLIIFAAVMANATGPLGDPSITGGSLTYVPIGTTYGNASWAIRMDAWYALVGASPPTFQCTVNYGTAAASLLVRIAFTGHDTGTPIAGFVGSGSTNINDGSESQTLVATPTSDDVTLYSLDMDCDANPANPTMAEGWNKIYDFAHGAGYGQLVVAHRESSTSTTVTCDDVYTGAGSFYKGSMLSFIVKCAGGAITKTLTDTATGTDNKPTISASLSVSDTGVGTDDLSITKVGGPVLVSSSDSSVGTDQTSIIASLSITDVGSGLDSVSIVPSTPPSIVDNPVIGDQNTTYTNDLDPDGFTWAQGHPIIVDKYGKLISAERNTTNGIAFEFSNDGGATWNDGLIQAFILRGCLAYDSTNDILHVLWNCSTATDGILYRRYTINRDGSNNITSISRDMSINLQLDYQTSGEVTYDHPVLLWMNDAGFGTYGALVAIWGIDQSAGTLTGGEVRTSMRVLSNDANDNTAGNWTYPVTNSSSTIDVDAQVPYTMIVNSGDQWGRMYPSASRKILGTNAKDIYVVYGVQISGFYYYKFRRMQWNAGANNWSTGLSSEVTITARRRAGTDSGYAAKEQLITDPREDNLNDCMVIGFATWKDNTDGDSWGYALIEANDTVSSIVDVYISGAENCGITIFVTGDIVVDNGYIISAYTDLPNKNCYVRCFNHDGTEAQDDLLVFDTMPVDIPTLWQDGINARYDNGDGDKLLVAFRDFNVEARNNPPTYTPPYKGYVGTLDWILAGVEAISVADTGLGTDSLNIITPAGFPETFEDVIDNWAVEVDTNGTGAVTRSDEQADTGTYSAKCFTTASGDIAQVRYTVDSPWASVPSTFPGEYYWQRLRMYIPSATINALSGAEYIDVAGLYPSAGGGGWWLRVMASGAIYAVGYAPTGAGPQAFSIYGTVPTDQWFTLEIGLHSRDKQGYEREFAVIIDGAFRGWYRRGYYDVTIDRIAAGILATNSTDDLAVYVDNWYLYTSDTIPSGADNRPTSNSYTKDYTGASGENFGIDWYTWWNDVRLDSDGIWSHDSRLQAGINFERMPDLSDGWAEMTIQWVGGTTPTWPPSEYFAPMIAFRKNIGDEINLEVQFIYSGGNVLMHYDAWVDNAPHDLATWQIPDEGDNPIPGDGDKVRVRWQAASASTLHVVIDYFDATTGVWSLSVIDTTDDVTNIGGHGDSFFGPEHNGTEITIDSTQYAISSQTIGIYSSFTFSISVTETGAGTDNISISITQVIVGSTVWGQSTGALETNIRTFTGNWTGTGSITGAGDEEKLVLDTGQYMISEVVNTGIVTVTLLQNEYSSGDTVTLQYRHGATQAACEAASWNDYTVSFESLGYVQVKVSV